MRRSAGLRPGLLPMPIRAGLTTRLLNRRQKRFPLFLQPLLQLPRAITIAARPRLRAIFMPAIFPIVRVLDAEQLEIFFPIRTLLSQRRGAKTSFHPVSHAIVSHPGMLQIVNVFITGNRTASQRTVRNGFEQRFFPASLDPRFDQITHRHKITLTRTEFKTPAHLYVAAPL